MKLWNSYTINHDVLTTVFFELSVINRVNILECGSGQSTIAIANKLRERGAGKIYSLEHSLDRFEMIRQSIFDHQLQQFCQIIYAPLTHCADSLSLNLWYDISELWPEEKIDMLIVDSPIAFAKDMSLSRYPAMIQLKKFLADDTIVYLDDIDRPGESEILDRWKIEHPDFTIDTFKHRNCAELRRSISDSKAA
jgi:predicted O-methyltransferase YrrM